ncbi:MAG: hypothetical protein AAGF11_11120 [Myxococcota bacterium]
MHPFTAPRTRPVPTARLRALLAEPGGRRRLIRAIDDELSSTRPLDDQQLLMRARELTERGRLRDLEL